MEPRGGIEPPHVHGVVHGRRFRFCYCTRHICCLFQQSGTVFISPTSENVSLYSGTGGRLCSPNLRFWRPALSIELHPYIYRPQRRYAPGWVRLSGGLFERVRICTSHGPVPAWISGFRTALPLTANQSLTTGLSKHFSASTYSATAQWEASLLFQVPARGQVATRENQTPHPGLGLYQLRRV